MWLAERNICRSAGHSILSNTICSRMSKRLTYVTVNASGLAVCSVCVFACVCMCMCVHFAQCLSLQSLTSGYLFGAVLCNSQQANAISGWVLLVGAVSRYVFHCHRRLVVPCAERVHDCSHGGCRRFVLLRGSKVRSGVPRVLPPHVYMKTAQ